MQVKFDTSVQELKYKVLKEIAKGLFNDTLLKEYNEIPYRISPGPKSTGKDITLYSSFLKSFVVTSSALVIIEEVMTVFAFISSLAITAFSDISRYQIPLCSSPGSSFQK